MYFNTADEAGTDDCSNLAKCGCEHCDDTCGVKEEGSGGEVSPTTTGEVSTCNDTTDWTTSQPIWTTEGTNQTCQCAIQSKSECTLLQRSKCLTCEQMSAGVSPNCKDGKVMFPNIGNRSESEWNEPEKNCCACGKGSDDWKGWEEDNGSMTTGEIIGVIFGSIIGLCFLVACLHSMLACEQDRHARKYNSYTSRKQPVHITS